MNKKIIYIIISMVIVCATLIVVSIFLTREDEKVNQNQMNHQSDLGNFDNSNFNFETRTVTLNSGYVMPLNGIGTYSLTDDEMNAINSLDRNEKHDWY